MRFSIRILIGGVLALTPTLAAAEPGPSPPPLVNVGGAPAPSALAPLPAVATTQPAAAPLTAAPAPTVEPAPPAPELAPPTTVAPIIVPKAEKADVAGKAGLMAVGVAAGAGGAAVAGPVGKFAGALLGKTVARGLFGIGKEKTPEVTVIQRDPQAELAAAEASSADAPR